MCPSHCAGCKRVFEVKSTWSVVRPKPNKKSLQINVKYLAWRRWAKQMVESYIWNHSDIHHERVFAQMNGSWVLSIVLYKIHKFCWEKKHFNSVSKSKNKCKNNNTETVLLLCCHLKFIVVGMCQHDSHKKFRLHICECHAQLICLYTMRHIQVNKNIQPSLIHHF